MAIIMYIGVTSKRNGNYDQDDCGHVRLDPYKWMNPKLFMRPRTIDV